MPSTSQVVGYIFLTFAEAAAAARSTAAHWWQLLFDLLKRENTSSIIPNHPRCAPHPPVHPTASADAHVPFAAGVAQAYGRVRLADALFELRTPRTPTRLGSLAQLAQEAICSACGVRLGCVGPTL